MPDYTAELISHDMKPTNLLAIQSVVKQSYVHAKKHLQDGVSFVKDEIVDMYDKAGDCISKMVLPINNFLKDLSQIDEEFRSEVNRNVKQTVLVANIIPIEQALSGYMEENY